MAISDINIQLKIRESDIAEFEKLFNRFYEPLCRQAFSVVHDMDAAEDIVQEFFYSFWKNRQQLSIRLALSAYMFRSVRNNALHYLKHRAVEQQYEGEMKNMATTTVLPETSLMQDDELNQLVEKALHEMPPRCSEVFKMSRFEGKKYREIAETMKISVKTVEADMGKALQFFRKQLSEYTTGETG